MERRPNTAPGILIRLIRDFPERVTKLNFERKRREVWTILQAEKKNITLWKMED